MIIFLFIIIIAIMLHLYLNIFSKNSILSSENVPEKSLSDNSSTDQIEGFMNSMCPDTLFYKGDKIHLYNSKVVNVPGANPVIFDNLEDYVEYLKWQRSRNVKCPVLLLNKMYDTQGNFIPQKNNEFNILKSDLKTKITSSHDKFLEDTTKFNPHNKSLYSPMDQSSQYIGVKSPIDDINNNIKNSDYSASAMDHNWMGQEASIYTPKTERCNNSTTVSSDKDVELNDKYTKV
jgi:hypothetical protein